MALLEISGIDVFYGRVQALHGESLEVDQGEVVALIGSNGAGKTTTLRTISGLHHPVRGTIKFDGTITVASQPRRMTTLNGVPAGMSSFETTTLIPSPGGEVECDVQPTSRSTAATANARVFTQEA